MSTAQRERAALCATAETEGPDAPTLSGDWTVRDLLVHLVVREGSPVGAPGIVLPPLAFLTERVSRRLSREPFDRLLQKVRNGPPRLSPMALPVVDATANALEFFVHHEDIRRAQPQWRARVLDPRDDDTLWRRLTVMGRLLVRPAGVPVVLRRSDTGETATIRPGAAPVVVTGPVAELVLFLYGRSVAEGLSFEGPPDRVARLRSASLGV